MDSQKYKGKIAMAAGAAGLTAGFVESLRLALHANATESSFAIGMLAGTLSGLSLAGLGIAQSKELIRRFSSQNDLSKAITSNLDLSATLSTTLAGLQKLIKSDGAIIYVTEPSDPATKESSLSYGIEPKFINQLTAAAADISEHEIRAVHLLSDINGYSECVSQALIATLVSSGQSIGYIALERRNAPFQPNDSVLLKQSAVIAQCAITNALVHKKAKQLAERDGLTGLYNHRALSDRLEVEIQRSEREGRPMALLLMDVNDFKVLNDTFGHPVGDAILRGLSFCLQDLFRVTDIVGRCGGDEFMALAPNTTEEETALLVERLHEALEDPKYRIKGIPDGAQLRLSIGISHCPVDGTDAASLISIADTRLYEAKMQKLNSSTSRRFDSDKNKAINLRVLEGMVESVDVKDKYTKQHSRLVAKHALMMAQELGFSQETQRTVRLLGTLHNIGLIGVPEHLLSAAGKLSHEETEIVRRHPILGSQIVGSVAGFSSIAEGIRSHHERFDGEGYPDGLRGEDIPILARLLAVADAYSAMLISRPYRKAKTKDEALLELKKGSGRQFDPAMVDVMDKALRKHLHAEIEAASEAEAEAA